MAALCPAAKAGTVAKGLINIIGSVVQYSLETEEWNVENASFATIEGIFYAGMDIGVN